MATSNPATSTPILQDWATQPLGKIVRVATAVVGMISATALLAVAPLASNGSWVMIVTGLAVVITSVRVAVQPTLSRIVLLAIPAVAIPFVTQLL